MLDILVQLNFGLIRYDELLLKVFNLRLVRCTVVDIAGSFLHVEIFGGVKVFGLGKVGEIGRLGSDLRLLIDLFPLRLPICLQLRLLYHQCRNTPLKLLLLSHKF